MLSREKIRTDLDFDFKSTLKALNLLFVQVLKALQDAVTNHNLAAQSNPPVPEPTPSSGNAKSSVRQLPIHSFQVRQSRPGSKQIRLTSSLHVNCCIPPCSQVKMVRSGRQTVSVNVDGGVLHFDKKAGSFGAERVSHDRSATTRFHVHACASTVLNVMTRPELSRLSHFSPADRQVPE